MEWVIESYDRRTDRDAEHSFATESAWTCPALVESVFDFTLPALRTEAG